MKTLQIIRAFLLLFVLLAGVTGKVKGQDTTNVDIDKVYMEMMKEINDISTYSRDLQEFWFNQTVMLFKQYKLKRGKKTLENMHHVIKTKGYDALSKNDWSCFQSITNSLSEVIWEDEIKKQLSQARKWLRNREFAKNFKPINKLEVEKFVKELSRIKKQGFNGYYQRTPLVPVQKE